MRSSWPPSAPSPPATCGPPETLAERVRDLPFYREEGHLATARLIVVAALAGDWDEAARPGRAVPRGMGAGRPATRRQPQPRRLRGGDRPRAARGRRRPGCLAGHRGRPGDAGTALVGDPFRRVLRRPATAAPRPPRTGAAPAGHAAGGVPGLVQRDVATVVRRAVGRGGRAHRERGRRRPHPPRMTDTAPRRRPWSGPGRRPRRADPGGRRPAGRRVPLPVGPNARSPRRGGTGAG